MSLSKTTPELLAEKIISTIGSSLSYPDLPANGAGKAARLLVDLLKKNLVF